MLIRATRLLRLPATNACSEESRTTADRP